MKDIKVRLISTTDLEKEDMGALIKLTFVNEPWDDLYDRNPEQDQLLIDNIVDMDHQSITEHAAFTFLLEGVSRTFLAQITRHRIASYTSKSQQYQDHSGFPYLIPEGITKNGPDAVRLYGDLMDRIDSVYRQFMSMGVHKDEARYVLPNACRVTLAITMNTRSLFNMFMQRLCRLNTIETKHVATLMLNELFTCGGEGRPNMYGWLFKKVGPQCASRGGCVFKHRSCGRPWNISEVSDKGVLE